MMPENAFDDCHAIVESDDPLEGIAEYTRVADDQAACPSTQFIPTYDFLSDVAYTDGTFFAGEGAPASDAVTFCSASDIVRIGSSANAAENQAVAIIGGTERVSGFTPTELMILFVTDVGDGSLG